MAQYSFFVLKVPLNTNQPGNICSSCSKTKKGGIFYGPQCRFPTEYKWFLLLFSFCTRHGPNRPKQEVPSDLIKVADLMMPRLLIRLVQHLRDNSPHSKCKLFVTAGRNFWCLIWILFTALKGHIWRRLTYIFSPSIKSLIYHIFTYKVWTVNFYSKGSEIWSFILMLGNPNSAGRSYRPLGGDFFYLHCQPGVACWLCSVH